MVQERTVLYENNEIHYLLEQKPVKNLNLRVHKDCKVYVSANSDIPTEKVDDFVGLQNFQEIGRASCRERV